MSKWTIKKNLLPYQQKFVEDQSDYKIWCAARQIGKSTAVSFEALNLAIYNDNCASLIVSSSQRQSDEFVQKVRVWLDVLREAGLKITTRETTEEIALSNGSRIISLPANPRTIRGFTGNIFLDEFAFHQDSEAIWQAVFPMITRGYKIRITSTPNGKQNMFYEIWERGGNKWSRHETSIYDAEKDKLKIDIGSLRESTPDPISWAQEYEVAFIDEATAFLTYELIEQAESNQAGNPQEISDGPFYIGADIGRRRDLTVYWVLESMGDILWTREVIVLKNASFHEQDRNLDRLVFKYKPQRICMDQSGMGERVVEEAKARYGRSRTEGLLFSAPVKHDLVQNLRRHFEDRTIRIPIDSKIREDLHSVQRITTAAGNIRYDAERSGDGHADRFWALALAIHAVGIGSKAPKVNLPKRPMLTMPNKIAGF